MTQKWIIIIFIFECFTITKFSNLAWSQKALANVSSLPNVLLDHGICLVSFSRKNSLAFENVQQWFSGSGWGRDRCIWEENWRAIWRTGRYRAVKGSGISLQNVPAKSYQEPIRTIWSSGFQQADVCWLTMCYQGSMIVITIERANDSKPVKRCQQLYANTILFPSIPQETLA